MNLLRPGTRLRQQAVRGRSLSSVAWNPSKLTGLVAWYTAGPLYCFSDDAGTTPVTDGAVTALATDRSGNGRHLAQTTDASRPLNKLTSGVWEMWFDGSNDFMQRAAFPLAGDLTVGMVFSASGTAGILYEQSATASLNPGSYLYGTTGDSSRTMRAAGSSGKNRGVNWATGGTRMAVTQSCSGTHAGHLFYLNGVLQSMTNASGTGNPGTGSVTDTLNVGGRNGASLFSTMRLREMVVATGVAAAELAKLNSYLTGLV